MSNVLTPDFGRNPCIEEGDCVIFRAGEEQFTGVVLEVLSRFAAGPLYMQAKWVEVGVPLEDGSEEGEWIIENVRFSDIIARRHKTIEDFDDTEAREGKVLQFESVSCNGPQDMV